MTRYLRKSLSSSANTAKSPLIAFPIVEVKSKASLMETNEEFI